MNQQMFNPKKAVKEQLKLRMAIHSVAGGGKTFTALGIAQGLKGDGRVLLFDSENRTALLYSDQFDFDHQDLPNTSVDTYFAALEYLAQSDYSVGIIDGISGAWEDLVAESDRITQRSRNQSSFAAWAKLTPVFNSLVQKIRSTQKHIIVTMRTKSEYTMETYSKANGDTGTRPKKIGLAPVFRQNGDYEFDIVGSMDAENQMTIEKTRYSPLNGKIIMRPGVTLGTELKTWLDSGAVAAVAEVPKANGVLNGGTHPAITSDHPFADYVTTIQHPMIKGKKLMELGTEKVRAVLAKTKTASPEDIRAMQEFLGEA